MNSSENFINTKITKENLHQVKVSQNAERTYAMQGLMDGYRDVVIKLIENDEINFDIQDKKGRSLMHYAVDEKDKELIKILIKKNISINLKDSKGKTPFSGLFNNGNNGKINNFVKTKLKLNLTSDLDFANWLIKHGADANISDNKGDLPLHIAAKQHDVNTISFLLKVTKYPDKTNHTGLRPIHNAVESNNLAITQKFLYYRVNILATDNTGGNILHHALKNDDDRIIKFLLKKTKAVQMLNKQDIKNKQTPFQRAIANKKFGVVHEMINIGADINKESGRGVTPLTLAVRSKSTEMTEMILHSGADIINTSVLHDSIYFHDDDCSNDALFNIILDNSFDIDASSSLGVTPLMRTLECAQNHLAQKLLDEGADTAKLSDNKRNVLFFLNTLCSDDILRKLIKKGADVNHINENGTPVLHKAIEGSHNENHIKILIENGADINTPNKYNRILLHIVLMHNQNVSLAEWLVDNGADIKTKIENNVTILHMAAESSDAHKGLLQKILEKNAISINSINTYGDTPLHNAIKYNSLENVEILLKAGANPHIKNKHNISPFMAAQKHYNKAMIGLFYNNQKHAYSDNISDKFNKKKNEIKANDNHKKPPNNYGGRFTI